MSLRLRKDPTASGATTVQIATKRHGRLTIIEHLGSTHTPAQLPALEDAIREKNNESTGQLSLNFDTGNNAGMDSFLTLLHKNVLYHRLWATREQLRIAIVTRIERTYHQRRWQALLGRLAPIEYEAIVEPVALVD